MINMYAKSGVIEDIKKVGEENSYRISQLEAKIEKSRCHQDLQSGSFPSPPFIEVNAPGIDVKNDVFKSA